MSLVKRRFTPGVPVTLEVVTDEAGNREMLSYRLAFNFNSFAAIEEKTGLNLLKGELFKNINATNLVAIFWGSLLLHQPDYVDEEGFVAAGELLTMENSPVILSAVKNAFLQCLPKKEREEVERKEAEGASAPLASTPAEQ